jgi:hypothetical protein
MNLPVSWAVRAGRLTSIFWSIKKQHAEVFIADIDNIVCSFWLANIQGKLYVLHPILTASWQLYWQLQLDCRQSQLCLVRTTKLPSHQPLKMERETSPRNVQYQLHIYKSDRPVSYNNLPGNCSNRKKIFYQYRGQFPTSLLLNYEM